MFGNENKPTTPINIEGYDLRDYFASVAPVCPTWYANRELSEYEKANPRPELPTKKSYYTEREYAYLFGKSTMRMSESDDLTLSGKVRVHQEMERNHSAWEEQSSHLIQIRWGYYYADQVLSIRNLSRFH